MEAPSAGSSAYVKEDGRFDDVESAREKASADPGRSRDSSSSDDSDEDDWDNGGGEWDWENETGSLVGMWPNSRE